MPYYWTLYGIAINTDYYKNELPPATWGLIFDENLMPPYICVFEDIRPLSLIAALYLFGHLEELNRDEIDVIKHVLKQQKKHVEIYTDNRSEYVLASGATPVVAGLSGDFLKVMRRFDKFKFLVPQEGAFAIIDSFAIPSASNKDDLIYPFLNYLFKKDTVQKYVDKFEFFPAVQVPLEYDVRFAEFIEPTEELFRNVHFFKNVVSSHVLNDVLIAIKS
jgi:spermidine/putrescine transport system substrate-binding protein